MSASITTDAEIAGLRAWGQELAAESPSEPRCIVEAFGTPRRGAVVMTMQMWIDLERARSPILAGRGLESDADLLAAAEIFGLPLGKLNAEEIALCAIAMERAGDEAFSLCLKMRHPEASGSEGGDDGFGTWLPVMAFLVSEGGVSWGEARGLDVRQAYAIMAAVRRNQGWNVAGAPYALRANDELGIRKFELSQEGAN